MASSLLSDYTINSIKGLDFLCSQRNLEVRYHNCNVLSTLPANCNASVTVNDTTLEGRGKTIEAAKQDAADRMIAHLEGRIVNPFASKTSKEINWNSPKMKHPCGRLQVFCGKIGILFQFSDCRSVSVIPPKYSATATVLNVTVTAEASTREAARKNVATKLLHKLGWDKRVDESSFNRLESNKLPETVESVSNPVQQLQDLCSQKNLELRYYDCHRLSSLPSNFNACVTVNGVTTQGRGKTMEAAKEKAATQMLDHLKGKSLNVNNKEKRQSKDPKNRSIWLQHPCSRLQDICQKRGLRFIFRDVKCLSSDPLRFSATATVLDVTVTAEASTKAEAKSNVATKLLLKLDWDRKTVNNLNGRNSDNSSVTLRSLNLNSSSPEKMKLKNNSQSNSLKGNELNDSTKSENLTSTLSRVQQQLKDLCLKKNLTFKYHDCQQYSMVTPMFNACLTVNDVTAFRGGKTMCIAKDKAAIAMIDHLNGKPVDFGYPTRRGYVLSNIFSEKEKSDPTCQLIYQCKKRNIDFQFDVKNLKNSPHRCSSSATVLGTTITAVGREWKEANDKVATEILAKLGWDKTNSEDGLLLEQTKHEDNTQDIIENIPEESRSFNSEPEEYMSEEFDDGKKPIKSCTKTTSSTGMIAETLFNNPKRSDITFLVGKPGEQKERIYGHSLIISLGSSELNELLEGDWKDKEEVELQCHPSSFMSIIRYVYTQEIIVNEDHLVETLILAIKYSLAGFLEVITSKKYLTEDFLKDNVCSLLQLAHERNDNCCTNAIWHQAAKYFDKHAKDLIQTDSFQNLSVEVITSLIRRTRMSVNELSLFYSTVIWAGKRCEEEALDETAENLRLKMEPFIRYIRFPLMTGDEFREGPGKTGILTGDECYKILCAICLGDKEECGFSYDPRYIINDEATNTESTLRESEASGGKDLTNEVPQELHQKHTLNNLSKDYIIPGGKFAGLTRCQRRNKQRAQKKQRERLGLLTP